MWRHFWHFFLSGLCYFICAATGLGCDNMGFIADPVGEGNGTPLQYSCLENPMDGGAW